MKSLDGRTLTGAETLRTVVAILNNCRESFNDRYTADQLMRIVGYVQAHPGRVMSDFPDELTPEEIDAALAWDGVA